MKTRNYFKAAAMMAMVLFASCSKEEIKDTQDNGLITLEVPALQSFNGNGNGQAQSRIAFDIPADGSVPKVRWEVGDNIYIGKIDADTKSGEILQNLITNGDFTVFTCTSVRGDNKATFQGEKLVAGSNLAVYTEKPNKVITDLLGTSVIWFYKELKFTPSLYFFSTFFFSDTICTYTLVSYKQNFFCYWSK